MGRLGRALATYLLLPVVSIALVLTVFEVGLRAAGFQAIYEIYSKPWIFWQYDELLGWSHQPRARGRYVGPRPWPIEFEASVEINSLGLRGPEITPREPGELRVLFLGDSMVAAFEVEYGETFVARIQDLLEDRLRRPVRTINAGVRGYGTDQSLLYFRDRGSKLDPDVVVFFHSGNDVSDNATLHEMRRPFGKAAMALTETGELELVGAPVPHHEPCSEISLSSEFQVTRKDTLIGRWMCRAQTALFDRSALFSFVTLAVPWDRALLTRLYQLGNPHSAELRRDRQTGSNYKVELTMALLFELASEVEQSGAEFFVMGDREQLSRLDLDRLAQNGIEPFTPDALSAMPREEVAWKHDSHYNPLGHRLLAEMLAEHLIESLDLPSARRVGELEAENDE